MCAIIYLEREAANDGIPHDYTAVKAFNGEVVIAPNCLQCHAQVFEDKLYIGLGNTFVDFSDRETLSVENFEKAEKFLKTLAPKKYKASEHFIELSKITVPQLYTETRGVNPPDRLPAVLPAHRVPCQRLAVGQGQVRRRLRADRGTLRHDLGPA